MLRKRVHPAHRETKMPLKIDIEKPILIAALQKEIASLKRANTNERNEFMRDIRDKEIAAIQSAINTISEDKGKGA